MKKAMIGCSLVFVVLAALAVHGCNEVGDEMCGNDVVQNVLSPDGHARAVVFERDCGATTGFSTQASIIGAHDSLPNSAGNVFIADDGTAPLGPGHTIETKAEWAGPQRLRFRYDRRAEVHQQSSHVLVWLSPFHGEVFSIRYGQYGKTAGP